MPIIEMPDGTELEFPEGMSQDAMRGAAQRHYQKQAQPEQGFLGDLYDAATSRDTAQILGGAIGSAFGSPSGPPGMVVGGSLGAGAGGQIHDFITGNVGTGGEQALKAGFDVGTDALMSVAAPKVLQAGSAIVKKGLSPVAKGGAKILTGTRGIGLRNAADVERMDRLGMKLDMSHLDNPTSQGIGTSMRQNVGSNSIMDAADTHNYNVLNALKEDTATSLGKSVTPQQAGEVLQDVAKKNRGAWWKVNNDLYDKVDTFLPERIPVPEVRISLQNSLDEALTTEERNAIESLQNIIGDGEITTKGLKSLKRIAKKAYDKPQKDDVTDIVINMRRALGADLDNAVVKSGSQEGSEALAKANKWWQTGMSDKDVGKVGLLDTFRDIIKQEEPSKAFGNTTANILNKNAGSKRLERVFSANPEAAGEIRAVVFRDLWGQGEKQSINTFLTNMGKLQPEARKLLFGEADKNIKELVDVSKIFKSLADKANFSNTESSRVYNSLLDPIWKGAAAVASGGGGVGVYAGNPVIGALTGAAIGTGAVAGKIGANIGMAKMMTNPRFVKWLTSAGKTAIFKPGDMAPQFARLATIASGEQGEMREGMISYMNELGATITQTKDKNGEIKQIEVK